MTPPYDLARRPGGKPLAVVFETPYCAACDEMHGDTFRRPEVQGGAHALRRRALRARYEHRPHGAGRRQGEGRRVGARSAHHVHALHRVLRHGRARGVPDRRVPAPVPRRLGARLRRERRLSQRTVVPAFHPGARRAAPRARRARRSLGNRSPEESIMPQRPIESIIAKQKILTAPASMTVRDAARQMKERNVGAVMVVDAGRLIGIFTERDAVFRVVAEGRDAKAVTLADVMTPHPQAIGPDKPVGLALLLMYEGRLPPHAGGESRPPGWHDLHARRARPRAPGVRVRARAPEADRRGAGLGACRACCRACDGGELGAVQGASPKAYRAYGEGEQRRMHPNRPVPSGCCQKARLLRCSARRYSRYRLRLAPRVHRFLARQRIRESKPDRLLTAIRSGCRPPRPMPVSRQSEAIA